MEESTTYQEILRKGRERARLEATRDLLPRQGTKKFGAPSEAVANGLNAMSDLERLERLVDRMLDATGWDELLQTS